ncbi:MAG: sugar transporter, partial [Chloroflexi bacterium]|nr:sugar transporter [Chloroflexota bacterium]
MRVVQFEIPGSGRRVGVVDGDEVIDITSGSPSLTYVFKVFDAAQNSGAGFEQVLKESIGASNSRLNYADLLAAPVGGDAPFLHAPVDHSDPHRVLISGTGLT